MRGCKGRKRVSASAVAAAGQGWNLVYVGSSGLKPRKTFMASEVAGLLLLLAPDVSFLPPHKVAGVVAAAAGGREGGEAAAVSSAARLGASAITSTAHVPGSGGIGAR